MRKLTIVLAFTLVSALPALAQGPHEGHGAHAGHGGEAGAAHAVATSPADGAMTNGSPEWFTATFEHPMTLKAVTVGAPGQAAVTVPVAAAAATTRVSAALPTLSPGNYLLNWTAQGTDGHQMAGVVRFMVH